jgi:hypothetical protein
MWNKFHRWLSICGMYFSAGCAYAETVSSLAEHAQKCLKVKYIGRIEYNFQKFVLQALGTIRFRFLQKSQKINFMPVYI